MEKVSNLNKLGYFFADDKRNVWMLYMAFALFNIVLAVQYRAPYAYPDEYGVFTAGNWMLGGETWSYKPSMYYGYTFSPFVGIMLRLFHGIRPVYIGALCVKALQLSLIPALAYKFLHEVLGTEDVRVKIFLSTAIGLYPSLTVYAKYVSNETTLHVTLFLCLYLVGKLAVGQSKNVTRLYSALLGFLALFAYASHGMGLAFIIAICMVVPVVHFFTKKKLVSYPFFIGALVVFYLLDAKMKDIVIAAVYYVPSGGMANTLESTSGGLISRVLGPGFIGGFFNMLISRLLYISASTFGLFLLSLITLLVFVFCFVRAYFVKMSNPRDNVFFVSAVFGVIIFLCGIGLSTLANIPKLGERSSMYFYGRYFEYMALPLILIGLQRLFGRSIEKMRLLKYAFVSLACYLFLTIYSQFNVVPYAADDVNRFFILGIIPFLGNTAGELSAATDQSIPLFDLFALGLFAMVPFTLMVYLLKGRHRLWSIVVLLIMFLYGTILDNFTVALPLSTANYRLFYSGMENIEVVLSEFKDIYKRYPKVYLVTNQLGADESTSNLIFGRAQLSFVDYNIARVLEVGELDLVSDPEEGFKDSIIISDREQIAYLDTNDAFFKIYESPNASIWIRGEGIRAYYAETRGT